MIYDVDLDDGRTVTLEADNPPSEQDIYAALQSYQPPAPRPQLQPGDLAGPEARQIPDLTTTTRGGPPAKLASFAETIQEPLALAPEMIAHEGITLPGISETIKKAGEQYIGGLGIRGVSTPTPPEQFTPAQKLASGAIQGVDELVEGVANFLSSSQGIAETGAAASPIAPAVYLKWANDMVRGGMLNAGEAYDAYKRGDWETFAKQVTGGLGMLLGAGAVTKHGVSKISEPMQAFTGGTPRLEEANAKALAATIPPEIPSITKAGETYASTIPETTSVPQLEVRPRVGEETPLRQSGQAPGTQQPVSGSPQAEVVPAVEPPKVEAKPPELMTPDEMNAARISPGETDVNIQRTKEWAAEMMGDKTLADDPRFLAAGGFGSLTGAHRFAISDAVKSKKPVSAIAVDHYNIALPEGYVREGDRYVYKPTTPPSETAAVTEAPISSEPATPPVTPEAKSPPPP